MYGWIWRRLPGPFSVKLALSVVLVVLVVAVLWYFVFPYVEPRLPWNHVTVDHTVIPSSTGSPR
jgi:hypothetical protein